MPRAELRLGLTSTRHSPSPHAPRNPHLRTRAHPITTASTPSLTISSTARAAAVSLVEASAASPRKPEALRRAFLAPDGNEQWSSRVH
ncbi:hypothetical protein VDGL01_10858 [Verticillium dahliae]